MSRNVHMTEPQQTPIIKGSWEDLLLQAQQLAAKQDDAAIDIYRKLTDRLSRLPANQRQAAEGRLQHVMRQAAVDLQYYLSYRDRYDEALAVNEKIRILLDDQEHKTFVRHAAAIRLQAGDVDQGLADLRAIAATSDELDPWGDALFAALDKRRYADAQEAVQSAEAWVNRHHRDALNSEDAKRDQAFVAYLKARQHAALNQPAEALAWYEFAAAQDPFYRQNPQYVYTHLVDVGAYAEVANAHSHRQAGSDPSQLLAGAHLSTPGSRRAEAQHAWHKAVKTELPDDGNVDYLELVLVALLPGRPRRRSGLPVSSAQSTRTLTSGVSSTWPGWAGPCATTWSPPVPTWSWPSSAASRSPRVASSPAPGGSSAPTCSTSLSNRNWSSIFEDAQVQARI